MVIANRPAQRLIAGFVHEHAEAASEQIGIVCVQTATSDQGVLDQTPKARRRWFLSDHVASRSVTG